MIGTIICWLKKEHKWGAWVMINHRYYQRWCLRCTKWETDMEKPE
ncbi:hypothetical protein LCGC14_0437260 [marine sediment metagenome]|uniref:Uncharacterized protein n=1 Tax=marine sediment metagenome TaxID=412755 RepID=A0A0F9SLD7_9ZZZZ